MRVRGREFPEKSPEHFQSNFRAISEQFQRDSRAFPTHFPIFLATLSLSNGCCNTGEEGGEKGNGGIGNKLKGSSC